MDHAQPGELLDLFKLGGVDLKYLLGLEWLEKLSPTDFFPTKIINDG